MQCLPSRPAAKLLFLFVACSGYGVDNIAAIDVVKKVRSGNGYAIAIVLKPFSFEGQRRRNEVESLIDELQKHVNLCLDIDTDLLLNEDFLTLDEAVKTANNAVNLAINSISVLLSASQRRYIVWEDDILRELEVSRLVETLECNMEAKIGFGSGYNIKASIFQAVYDCPFIGGGVKDSTRMAICIVGTSVEMTEKELLAFLRTFRRSTGYMNEIIISNTCEPSLEPNLLMTTVIAIGQRVPEEGNIFSKIAQKIPFMCNLMRKHEEQQDLRKKGTLPPEMNQPNLIDELDISNVPNMVPVNSTSNGPDTQSDKFQTQQSRKADKIYPAEESPSFSRDPLFSRNLGPGYAIAQEWAKESSALSSPLAADHLNSFYLPVGVRQTEKSKFVSSTQTNEPSMDSEISDDFAAESVVNDNAPPWSALTDASVEAVKSFYNSASIIVAGKQPDPPIKQGGLSVRAASMLEAERDVPKIWSPVIEMQYRGGVYKGRCQGGLPEGKGRLTLQDGSIYDGLWHNGKKAGSGTFYFRNGDLFQGSWREDLMHGKGWFYFHTGDRWFANFWKGKANGEGRFYSKSGDIFFGHFQDGLRHGQFICINVEGTRLVCNSTNSSLHGVQIDGLTWHCLMHLYL
uniref:Protein ACCUMULATION AND REPLICATION OF CHLOROPLASTS 3 n=1 Tax=Kalanchoe fedtschenkoi TaxID=63787 RepID=A0A7N0ZUG0_KALFE